MILFVVTVSILSLLINEDKHVQQSERIAYFTFEGFGKEFILIGEFLPKGSFTIEGQRIFIKS